MIVETFEVRKLEIGLNMSTTHTIARQSHPWIGFFFGVGEHAAHERYRLKTVNISTELQLQKVRHGGMDSCLLEADEGLDLVFGATATFVFLLADM